MNELLTRYANIPTRVRWGAIATVFVGLFFVYYLLVYAGQRSELEGELDELAKLEGQRAEKRAYADNLPKYEARLVQLQESLQTARAQLPDTADVPHLLAQIGDRAQNAGLSIQRFEPRGELEEDFYAEIHFDMAVSGSYHEIATFIDSVGKLDRIVNVTDISMLDPRTINQKVVVDGNFSVVTYRFLPDGPSGGKDKKKKKKKKKKK